MSGPPVHSKKISINHIIQRFNEEIKVNFTYLNIRGRNFPFLNVVYMGNGYSEIRLLESRKADKLIDHLYLIWLYSHRIPTELSADG